jgi:hypothetical protein
VNRRSAQAALFTALLLVISCHTTASTTEASPMEPTRAAPTGGPGRLTPPPPTPADELVLEMRTSSRHGQPGGYRILLDGRYETFGGPVAEDGAWWLLRQMTGEELVRFREQMDGLGLADLESRYQPRQPVADGGSTTWRLRIGDGIKEVVVRQGAVVPALDVLYASLPEQDVAESDVVEWTVADDGGEQTHAITCDEAPPLDAITWELAIRGQERPGGGPGQGAHRLLDISWKAAGVETSSQELWSDGWQLIKVAGAVDTRKQHEQGDIEAIRQMLEALDWDAIKATCP